MKKRRATRMSLPSAFLYVFKNTFGNVGDLEDTIALFYVVSLEKHIKKAIIT